MKIGELMEKLVSNTICKNGIEDKIDAEPPAQCDEIYMCPTETSHNMYVYCMAIASGQAGPVLAGPVCNENPNCACAKH